MDVVVPLRGVERRLFRAVAREPARRVGLVLENEMDLAAGQRGAGVLGDLGDDGALAVVEDRVHGVEAQAVEVILLEPIERVVDEEVAHRPRLGAVEIDARRPRASDGAP